MSEKRSVGKSIRSLSNVIRRHIDSSSSQIEMIDRVTGTNAWVIGFIAEQSSKGLDVYQKDLEEAFCITRSTVSKVIDLMVQKGLVQRQPVEHDARLKKMVLTPRALQIYDLMHVEGQKVEAILTAGFSEKELEELFGYFNRIKQNLELHGISEEHKKDTGFKEE